MNGSDDMKSPHTPETAEVFDEYQEQYAETVNKSIAFSGLSLDFFSKCKAGYIIEEVTRHLGDPGDASLLDIGCGVGTTHGELLKKIGNITGVDISRKSIQRAEEKNPKGAYLTYSGERLPFADNSFEVTLTMCVMHHVNPENWQLFVQEMHRVTKPDGLALVFEHNPKNPLTRRAVNQCPFDEDAVLLSPKTIMGLGRKAGFSAIACHYILTIPGASPLLRRIDSLFCKLPLGGQYFIRMIK